MLYTDWDIRNEGRSWEPEEALERWRRLPHKTELIEGQIFWSGGDPLDLLGVLLEKVGADRVVQLGDPEVWRRAVAKLGD